MLAGIRSLKDTGQREGETAPQIIKTQIMQQINKLCACVVRC